MKELFEIGIGIAGAVTKDALKLLFSGRSSLPPPAIPIIDAGRGSPTRQVAPLVTNQPPPDSIIPAGASYGVRFAGMKPTNPHYEEHYKTPQQKKQEQIDRLTTAVKLNQQKIAAGEKEQVTATKVVNDAQMKSQEEAEKVKAACLAVLPAACDERTALDTLDCNTPAGRTALSEMLTAGTVLDAASKATIAATTAATPLAAPLLLAHRALESFKQATEELAGATKILTEKTASLAALNATDKQQAKEYFALLPEAQKEMIRVKLLTDLSALEKPFTGMNELRDTLNLNDTASIKGDLAAQQAAIAAIKEKGNELLVFPLVIPPTTLQEANAIKTALDDANIQAMKDFSATQGLDPTLKAVIDAALQAPATAAATVSAALDTAAQDLDAKTTQLLDSLKDQYQMTPELIRARVEMINDPTSLQATTYQQLQAKLEPNRLIALGVTPRQLARITEDGQKRLDEIALSGVARTALDDRLNAQLPDELVQLQIANNIFQQEALLRARVTLTADVNVRTAQDVTTARDLRASTFHNPKLTAPAAAELIAKRRAHLFASTNNCSPDTPLTLDQIAKAAVLGVDQQVLEKLLAEHDPNLYAAKEASFAAMEVSNHLARSADRTVDAAVTQEYQKKSAALLEVQLTLKELQALQTSPDRIAEAKEQVVKTQELFTKASTAFMKAAPEAIKSLRTQLIKDSLQDHHLAADLGSRDSLVMLGVSQPKIDAYISAQKMRYEQQLQVAELQAKINVFTSITTNPVQGPRSIDLQDGKGLVNIDVEAQRKEYNRVLGPRRAPAKNIFKQEEVLRAELHAAQTQLKKLNKTEVGAQKEFFGALGLSKADKNEVAQVYAAEQSVDVISRQRNTLDRLGGTWRRAENLGSTKAERIKAAAMFEQNAPLVDPVAIKMRDSYNSVVNTALSTLRDAHVAAAEARKKTRIKMPGADGREEKARAAATQQGEKLKTAAAILYQRTQRHNELSSQLSNFNGPPAQAASLKAELASAHRLMEEASAAVTSNSKRFVDTLPKDMQKDTSAGLERVKEDIHTEHTNRRGEQTTQQQINQVTQGIARGDDAERFYENYVSRDPAINFDKFLKEEIGHDLHQSTPFKAFCTASNKALPPAITDEYLKSPEYHALVREFFDKENQNPDSEIADYLRQRFVNSLTNEQATKVESDYRNYVNDVLKIPSVKQSEIEHNEDGSLKTCTHNCKAVDGSACKIIETTDKDGNIVYTVTPQGAKVNASIRNGTTRITMKDGVLTKAYAPAPPPYSKVALVAAAQRRNEQAVPPVSMVNFDTSALHGTSQIAQDPLDLGVAQSQAVIAPAAAVSPLVAASQTPAPSLTDTPPLSVVIRPPAVGVAADVNGFARMVVTHTIVDQHAILKGLIKAGQIAVLHFDKDNKIVHLEVDGQVVPIAGTQAAAFNAMKPADVLQTQMTALKAKVEESIDYEKGSYRAELSATQAKTMFLLDQQLPAGAKVEVHIENGKISGFSITCIDNAPALAASKAQMQQAVDRLNSHSQVTTQYIDAMKAGAAFEAQTHSLATITTDIDKLNFNGVYLDQAQVGKVAIYFRESENQYREAVIEMFDRYGKAITAGTEFDKIKAAALTPDNLRDLSNSVPANARWQDLPTRLRGITPTGLGMMSTMEAAGPIVPAVAPVPIVGMQTITIPSAELANLAPFNNSQLPDGTNVLLTLDQNKKIIGIQAVDDAGLLQPTPLALANAMYRLKDNPALLPAEIIALQKKATSYQYNISSSRLPIAGQAVEQVSIKVDGQNPNADITITKADGKAVIDAALLAYQTQLNRQDAVGIAARKALQGQLDKTSVTVDLAALHKDIDKIVVDAASKELRYFDNTGKNINIDGTDGTGAAFNTLPAPATFHSIEGLVNKKAARDAQFVQFDLAAQPKLLNASYKDAPPKAAITIVRGTLDQAAKDLRPDGTAFVKFGGAAPEFYNDQGQQPQGAGALAAVQGGATITIPVSEHGVMAVADVDKIPKIVGKIQLDPPGDDGVKKPIQYYGSDLNKPLVGINDDVAPPDITREAALVRAAVKDPAGPVGEIDLRPLRVENAVLATTTHIGVKQDGTVVQLDEDGNDNKGVAVPPDNLIGTIKVEELSKLSGSFTHVHIQGPESLPEGCFKEQKKNSIADQNSAPVVLVKAAALNVGLQAEVHQPLPLKKTAKEREIEIDEAVVKQHGSFAQMGISSSSETTLDNSLAIQMGSKDRSRRHSVAEGTLNLEVTEEAEEALKPPLAGMIRSNTSAAPVLKPQQNLAAAATKEHDAPLVTRARSSSVPLPVAKRLGQQISGGE